MQGKNSRSYQTSLILLILDRGFPMKHLVLISTNGTVWDISLNEIKSPSKKRLFKLPDSCEYHGYSDGRGILYFIMGKLGSVKRVRKYHFSYGLKIGEKIDYKCKFSPLYEFAINPDCSEVCFTQSVQIGNKFWILGKTSFSLHFELTTLSHRGI